MNPHKYFIRFCVFTLLVFAAAAELRGAVAISGTPVMTNRLTDHYFQLSFSLVFSAGASSEITANSGTITVTFPAGYTVPASISTSFITVIWYKSSFCNHQPDEQDGYLRYAYYIFGKCHDDGGHSDQRTCNNPPTGFGGQLYTSGKHVKRHHTIQHCHVCNLGYNNNCWSRSGNTQYVD
jgi:hypothetical protein